MIVLFSKKINDDIMSLPKAANLFYFWMCRTVVLSVSSRHSELATTVLHVLWLNLWSMKTCQSTNFITDEIPYVWSLVHLTTKMIIRISKSIRAKEKVRTIKNMSINFNDFMMKSNSSYCFLTVSKWTGRTESGYCISNYRSLRHNLNIVMYVISGILWQSVESKQI